MKAPRRPRRNRDLNWPTALTICVLILLKASNLKSIAVMFIVATIAAGYAKMQLGFVVALCAIIVFSVELRRQYIKTASPLSRLSNTSANENEYIEKSEAIKLIVETGETGGEALGIFLEALISRKIRLSSRHYTAEPADVVVISHDENGHEKFTVIDKRADIIDVRIENEVEITAYRQDPSGRDWPSPILSKISRRRGRITLYNDVIMVNKADFIAWLRGRIVKSQNLLWRCNRNRRTQV